MVNTPGAHDGFVEGFVDGEMVSQVTGLLFRTVPELGIDFLDLTAFFGGGDASWATTKDEVIYFDDFFIYAYTAASGEPRGHVLRNTQAPLPAVPYPEQSVLSTP